MDFVQRNLINERNNLQIELAKAKIRIAQLNESAVEGLKKVIQNAHADKDNLSVAGAQVAASATKALRNMGKISHDNENHHFGDDLKPFELSEQAEYISDLENVIVTIAESINVSAADLYETYRITPARRDLLDKIQSKAMRDLEDISEPTDIERRISNMSRINRIQMIKMMGKPSDKRTHAEHPIHRHSYSVDSYFQDGNRSPDQLTDRAIKSDLSVERVREIRNRPNDKTAN